jgi:hypothetical protein
VKVPVKRCKSCGARVIWAVSEKSNTMIVDASPVVHGKTLDRHGRPIPEGNVTLEDRGALDNFGNWAPTAVVGTQAPLFSPDQRRVDHHVTCPHANKHRRQA